MSTHAQEILREIQRLSEDEQDPPVRDFFDKLASIEDEVLIDKFISEVLNDRPNISAAHLPYLLYVSLQYITKFDYNTPVSKERLKSDLRIHRDEIIELCREKNVSTNIVERYFHLQLILEIIGEPVTIADLGSSLGVGLGSLNSDCYSTIDIHPRLQEIWNNDAQIEQAYGIDIQEPNLSWAKACYFPENQDDLNELEARHRTFVNEPQFEFVKGNILKLRQLDIPKLDVVWTSNILYQIEGDKKQVRENIRSVLVEDGIWVNADYRHDGEDFKHSQNPYLSKVQIKGDWSNSLEVLESPSDRVEAIKPGEDFQAFVSQYT